MALVKDLGFRFLWVDSLCVVQDDQISLKNHLEHMHAIYFNSYFTIVAADGPDAEYGLRGIPGISEPRATPQIFNELGNGEKLLFFRERGFNEHPGPYDYYSRGWTFQEFMFAKRRLIFQDGLVQWQCSCAQWNEHLLPQPTADAWYLSPERGRTSEWLRTSVPNPTHVSNVVAVFNTKELTFPEDVLRAFSGIQAMLHKTYPGGLLFGLPCLFFDICLLWVSDNDLKRRRPSSSFDGDPFEDALPSWSWMGWQGRTTFPKNLEYMVYPVWEGFSEPMTEWYTMANPKAPVERIELNWHEHKRLAQTDSSGLESGWTRQEVDINEADWESSWRPKDVTRYVYTHESEPAFSDSVYKKYLFPVPIPSGKMSPRFQRQTQYLFCRTSRAMLYGDKADDASPFRNGTWGSGNSICIRDNQGRVAGSLKLHHHDDMRLFAEGGRLSRTLELVAVVKGYTRFEDGWTCPKFSDEQEDEWQDLNHSKSESLDTKTAGYAEMRNQSSGLNEGPLVEEQTTDGVEQRVWESLRDDIVNCVFVLWIEWKGEIAYRRGSGLVLEDAWVKYKEKDLIDLTLG